MVSHVYEAAAKSSMVLDDARILSEWRKDFHGVVSRNMTVGHRSVGVDFDTKDATSEDIECVWCGKPGHKPRK